MVEKNIKENIELGNKGNYFSIGFFLIVFILTSALYFYNWQLLGNIESLKKQIAEDEKAIQNIRNEKEIGEKIMVYELIEKNKNSLNKLNNLSQITTFIEEFERIGEKYKLELGSFSYSNGNLSTSVEVNSNNKTAYLALTKFIEDYRKKDEKALFDLGFISSVSGNKTIKLSINLSLKPLKK